MSRRNFLQFLTAAGLSGLGGYAFAEARSAARVVRYNLKPQGWPNGFNLRIGIIADLHACEPWMTAGRVAAICNQMNRLEPDIILLLGDYSSDMKLVTRHLSPNEWAQPLATLRAPLGVHAILGNHDWWDDLAAQADDGTIPIARRALEAVGIQVYSNHAVRLQKDGHSFWLAGLEDQFAILHGGKRRRNAMGKDDLNRTLEQITDDAPIILIAHEPDIFATVPKRVALTLSGHTHGGQVRLFGHAPYVPSRYGNRYAYGHIHEDGRDLIVSGGLGCSMLPVRFFSPPEVNLIETG